MNEQINVVLLFLSEKRKKKQINFIICIDLFGNYWTYRHVVGSMKIAGHRGLLIKLTFEQLKNEIVSCFLFLKNEIENLEMLSSLWVLLMLP
jgi:hypothetical protein